MVAQDLNLDITERWRSFATASGPTFRLSSKLLVQWAWSHSSIN